jgi:hypothetical protein
MRYVLKSLSIGAVLVAIVATPALAQAPPVSPARAVAIRDCNILASPFALYTWGNWQIYLYRECMAKHDQIE